MEISGSFSHYLSLMLGKPRIRLNNLKTSLRFPCLGFNPIIDSISHKVIAKQSFKSTMGNIMISLIPVLQQLFK